MIPRICAEMHCNTHVCKLLIEYAQMLSTAHRVLDGKMEIKLSKNNRRLKRYSHENEILYKSTHVNHPCAVWVRESSMNYTWLYKVFVYLCDEYTKRYNKTHLTDKKLRNILNELPKNIPQKMFTTFPKAMPDDVKDESVVVSYRNYYCKYKSEIAVWKNDIPYWFKI
jgi:hypothetical protein